MPALDVGAAGSSLGKHCQLSLAGEFAPAALADGDGAEGATAPETLRPTDRGGMALWRAGAVAVGWPGTPPKG
jgi:hypothetical protein